MISPLKFNPDDEFTRTRQRLESSTSFDYVILSLFFSFLAHDFSSTGFQTLIHKIPILFQGNRRCFHCFKKLLMTAERILADQICG